MFRCFYQKWEGNWEQMLYGGTFENNEEIKNTGEHMAANLDFIPVPKAKAVLGNEKWELAKAGFKAGADSTSPNANCLKECTMMIDKLLRATMRLGDKRYDKPNRKSKHIETRGDCKIVIDHF